MLAFASILFRFRHSPLWSVAPGLAIAGTVALLAAPVRGADSNSPSATPATNGASPAAAAEASPLVPTPSSVPVRGSKPQSVIEIAGPDHGGDSQLYKLADGGWLTVTTIRLSSKVVHAKCFHAADGSGWIALQEKAYHYDAQKQTLNMEKFGDKNTAVLSFDSEKRVTTRAVAGDTFIKSMAAIKDATPEKAAAEIEGLKTVEQQLTDAATEAWQFSGGTLVPYMRQHKSGTLTLEE